MKKSCKVLRRVSLGDGGATRPLQMDWGRNSQSFFFASCMAALINNLFIAGFKTNAGGQNEPGCDEVTSWWS